ncbi:MAG: hypothetical protein H6738_11510 [Alphaproteobacteria bacterium]|nr:hypothetical protein [Alphaproteobacteria bacterium]MCB9697398.1 hypothetical protein [Alphaproteobacteria bacterium]
MSEKGSAFERAVDELQLQAWLARAEFRHPSLHEEQTREEVGALARTRDELRLQVALGKLEARDEWETLEKAWGRVKHKAGLAADDAEETMHDLLAHIRDGYQRLRS